MIKIYVNVRTTSGVKLIKHDDTLSFHEDRMHSVTYCIYREREKYMTFW